jgi:hypothetical protein
MYIIVIMLYKAFHNFLLDYKHNKKTKGPTLMELFTATGKLKKSFIWHLEMLDMCITGDTAHIDTILKFLPYTRFTLLQWSAPLGTDHCSSEEYLCTHVDACVARTCISYLCVPCHPWCTHRTSLVVTKLLRFSCGCEQFHQGTSFDFLVISVCNQWEHYETPCI